MKKFSIISINIILIIASIFTIINLFYSFPSFKYTVLSKLILAGYALFLFILFINFLLRKHSNKKWQIVLTSLLLIGFGYGLFQVNSILLSFNTLLQGEVSKTIKTNLIAPKDSIINSVDDIKKDTVIGIQSITGFQHGNLPLDELRKLNLTDNIKQYSSFEDAYTALKNKEIDLMSGPELDNSKLISLNANFTKEYKIIKTFEADEAYQKVTKDITTTPFTILVSGIDSRSSDIKDVSNSDSNIIVTFNPNTGKITTLTTPRDSYIKLACGGYTNDKLTHAASYGGTKCVKETLENFYNIKIDYSLTINFVGVIDIIDALDGIKVDIPVNNVNINNPRVCEQDSHGVKDKLCWTEGKVNTLDGETALAFARNRYNQDSGDFSRGRNQQLVIEATLERLTEINNLNNINKLLKASSKHMTTSLSKDDIISLYEIFIGLNEDVVVEKLYISGSTGMVNERSVVYPNLDSVAYAKFRMHVNLGNKKPQFPRNGYFIYGSKPSYDNGNNPLRSQKMPFHP